MIDKEFAVPLASEKTILGHPEVLPIPDDLSSFFSPATHYVYEWKDYHCKLPGVDYILIGTERCRPLSGLSDVFRVRFENRLGLGRLQPVIDGRPQAPIYVEVLSPKFPTLLEHYSFSLGLLESLFEQAAQLTFTFVGETTRGVTEAHKPPTSLFALHFFLQFESVLRVALAAIYGAAHRRLADHPAVVPLAEAGEADVDVLMNILRNPDAWVPAQGFLLAERLDGRAPAEVWQRRPIDTFDTPENRFVLAFLRQLLAAAESLHSQRWWSNVPLLRKRTVREVTQQLQQALHWSMWAEVGPMHRLPLASRVLMRRTGYREMLQLWHWFNHARRPLFEPLQEAIELRDVATLYEFWVFFKLVTKIQRALDLRTEPVVEMRLSDWEGVGYGATARFGQEGTLVYNRRSQGYSMGLRPDYKWLGRTEVVLDAKFRTQRIEAGADEDDPSVIARTTRDDLYKMHTYRDALQVRSAVIIYPGNEPVFFDVNRGKLSDIGLAEILRGEVTGIGALPMSPANMNREVTV